MSGSTRHPVAAGLAVLAVVLAAVPACTAGDRPGARPGETAESGRAEAFGGMFRGYRTDYEPAADAAELAARSDAVVLGRLTRIREGRISGSGPRDPGRAEYLEFVFSVTRTVRGSVPGGVAYVESVKPGFGPASRFDAAAPHGAEALLYLRRTAGGEPPGRGAPAPTPLPAGARMMRFTTPQGFLLRLDGRVTAVFEPARPIFRGGDPEPSDLDRWLPPTLAGGPGGRPVGAGPSPSARRTR